MSMQTNYRWVPKDLFETIEHPQGRAVVYLYGTAERLCGIAYIGKAGRSAWNYRFRTIEQARQKAAYLFESLDQHERAKQDARKQAQKPHTIPVGAIIVNSWGYDQTNVDFYGVARVSANYVWLFPLGSQMVDAAGPMSGHVVPASRVWHESELKRHRVHVYGDGTQYVHFEFGCGSVTDGKPHYCSWDH